MYKSVKKGMLLICLTMIMAMTVFGCAQEKKEQQTDLKIFYGISADNEAVILLEGESVGKAYKEGDEWYLPYTLVNDNINDKFYYDEGNQRILYTTPDEIEMFPLADGKEAKKINEVVYISLSCMQARTEMTSNVYENPNRIAITQNFGEVTVCKPKEDMVIRQYNKDGADYMAEVSKGESLVIKETMDNSWYRVVKADGITGYLKVSDTNGEEQEQRNSEYQTPEYSHITLDETVCLGWHQVSGTGGNSTLEDMTAMGQGILNVVSPTWFQLADFEGNITSSAQSSYVERAHNMGMQVWALADDFSYSEDGTNYVGTVLHNFDSRQNLINNLVAEVKACGADGLNIDYEKIYEEIADDYIQFIRELSIQCRKEGIILSVDTYVTQAYNEFYNRKGIAEVADYLVIMGYDEHWAGDDEAGSVASLPYVKKGIEDAVAYTDPKRVINGVPFYTRVWTETKEGYADEGVFVEDAVNGNYWLTSQAVGMEVAEQQLATFGVTSVWLEETGQFYGEYQLANGVGRIWLEEECSIEAKLKVMEEAGIGGVACWKLGLEKAEVWDVIADYVNK